MVIVVWVMMIGNRCYFYIEKILTNCVFETTKMQTEVFDS